MVGRAGHGRVTDNLGVLEVVGRCFAGGTCLDKVGEEPVSLPPAVGSQDGKRRPVLLVPYPPPRP